MARKKKQVGEARNTDDASGISALDRIPALILQDMANSIRAHAGSEVLFLASTNGKGKVLSIKELAHGNRGMVPLVRAGAQAGDIFIHNHPSGSLVPSDADIRAAQSLLDQGIGTWIIDNTASRLYTLIDPPEEKRANLIDLGEVDAIFDANGIFAKRMPYYKPRDGQRAMVAAVVRGFNENLLVAVEAGTGVGKSYAYLVPAMQWVLKNKERVVISTATINLQEQLMHKDIPALGEILGYELKAVLAKGRGNYLCIKRLREAIDEEGLLLGQNNELLLIEAWAKTTVEGSKSDLGLVPRDVPWNRINSDADSCSGPRCVYRDECFFFKARKEAASAQIVVANHHLVFADAAMRNRGLGFENTVVLPAFQRLIFDEAHSLEEAATSFFSESLNRYSVLKYLSLLKRKNKQGVFGILPVLESLGILVFPSFDALFSRIRDAIYRMDAQGLQLMGPESSLRLEARYADVLEPLISSLVELQTAFMELGGTIQEALTGLELEEPIASVEELELMGRRIMSLAALCGSFRFFHQNPDRVYYLERLRGPGGEAAVSCIASPVDIGMLLKDSIFVPYQSIVMTSATLRTAETYDFFLRKLGLYSVQAPAVETWEEDNDIAQKNSNEDLLYLASVDRTLLTVNAQSPFNYKERVMLALPSDAPDPTNPQYQAWLQDFVWALLERSGGHGLVLFTSYDMLQKTWASVAPRLEASGICVLRQGDEDRTRLLKRFNEAVNSCLFATDSFWEGVDSPGETLQVVIICKLPFRVPTEPLTMARKEALEARGGNHFVMVSIPEAVMKLRQGFGRLMRRETDWGVVAIADPRISTKAYGRIFMNSLPDLYKNRAESSQLIEKAGEFLDYWREKRGIS